MDLFDNKAKSRGKLAKETVIMIFQSKETTAIISKKYNVNPTEIARIKGRKAYNYFTKHLEGEKPFPFKPGTFELE